MQKVETIALIMANWCVKSDMCMQLKRTHIGICSKNDKSKILVEVTTVVAHSLDVCIVLEKSQLPGKLKKYIL